MAATHQEQRPGAHGESQAHLASLRMLEGKQHRKSSLDLMCVMKQLLRFCMEKAAHVGVHLCEKQSDGGGQLLVRSS